MCGEPDVLAKREDYCKIGFPSTEGYGKQMKRLIGGTVVIVSVPFFRPEISVYVFLALKGGEIQSHGNPSENHQKRGFAEVLK